MPISIQDYINACTLEPYDYLNLGTIDFSAESSLAVTQFCSWLQNYLSVTHVSFVDSVRGGHIGVFLGRIRPEYLVQIFHAIRENQRIQHVELLNCHLEELHDTAANAAIGNCLASKPIVKITGNKDTRTEFSPELLLPIAKGITTDLELGFIYWRGGEEAFFNALTAQKDKLFRRVALVNNTAGRCSPEQLIKLCAMQTSVLDLSHNDLMLNCLSYNEWLSMIAQVETNHSLSELCLKDTYRQPYQDEEISLLQTLEPILINWVRNTHLKELDISANLWEDEFISQLKTAAAQRPSTLPHLKLLCCFDEYAEYTFKLVDKSDSSPETAVTAASAAEDVDMVTAELVHNPQLTLYGNATKTPPESSNGSLPGITEEERTKSAQYAVY